MTTDERIAEMSRQVAHARMERDATIAELAVLKRQCDSLRAVADAARDFAGEMTYSLPEDDPSAAASWRALMDSLVKAGMWE